MRPLLHILLSLCTAFLAACSHDPVSTGGSGDETTNSIVARVHYADGTPFSDAAVTIRPSTYLADTPADAAGRFAADTRTDSKGQFTVDSLDSGRYAIEINNLRDAAILIPCTLSTPAGRYELGEHRARSYASLLGTIDTTGIAETPLFVLVQGLERRVRVDQSGHYSLTDLPQGTYTLFSTEENAKKPRQIAGDIRAESGDTAIVAAPGWRAAKRVVVDATTLPVDLVAFPLCVRLDSSNFEFSLSLANGQDCRFTTLDGKALPHNVEHWDSTGNNACVWVLVDTVHAGTHNQMLFSVGNPDAAVNTDTSVVFDTADGWVAAWHMDMAGGAYRDASPNALHATPVGGATQGARRSGVCGTAGVFEDSLDHALTSPVDTRFPATDTIMFSAWLSTSSTPGGILSAASHDHGGVRLRMMVNTSGLIWFGIHDTLPLPDSLAQPNLHGWLTGLSTQAVHDSSWHHVAVVFARDGDAVAYIDGVRDTARDISHFWDYSLRNMFFDIGYDSFSSPSYYRGLLDEIRVRRGAVTPELIRFSFETQRPASTKVTIK